MKYFHFYCEKDLIALKLRVYSGHGTTLKKSINFHLVNVFKIQHCFGEYEDIL